MILHETYFQTLIKEREQMHKIFTLQFQLIQLFWFKIFPNKKFER